MSAPLPRGEHGALAGVKATPSGWPPASPEPSSGATTSSDRERDPTISSLAGLRGLPDTRGPRRSRC